MKSPNTPAEPPFDAIVVGGSFSGLSAALQLARARRRLLVVDAGLPRNRFAAHSHGFLGQDGR
ncbi:MAG: NAD(P)-binding protein, partial [Aquincola tertiaricarbonis]